MNPVRVILYVSDSGNETGSVEAAYHSVSRGLAGTPGLLGNHLLRSVADPLAFAVLSEWTDLNAFRDWEAGTTHRFSTARLRPLQDASQGRTFCIYEIVASY